MQSVSVFLHVCLFILWKCLLKSVPERGGDWRAKSRREENWGWFAPGSLLCFLTVNFGTLQCDGLCETIKKKGKLSKGKVGGGLLTKSCLPLASPWTIARQAPLSMGFSRQEYWSALPCPSPGDFPDPGIEYGSPALVAQRVQYLNFSVWSFT